jgi:hypothetical protein
MFGNYLWRLFLTVVVVLILRSAYFVGCDIVAVNESQSWPSVQGTVVRFTDVNGSGAPKSWRRDRIVEYSYQVDGSSYTGNQISFSKRSKWMYEDVKAITSTWVTMPEVRVFFDPKNPARSVLQPGGSNIANLLFIFAQVVTALALSFVLVYHIRSSAKLPATPNNASPNPPGA